MQLVLNTTIEHRPAEGADLVLYPPNVVVELDDAIAKDLLDRNLARLPEGVTPAQAAPAVPSPRGK